MDFALNTYMTHAGVRLREARPASTAEKAPSAPDKDKWLPFFPKAKKVRGCPGSRWSWGSTPPSEQSSFLPQGSAWPTSLQSSLGLSAGWASGPLPKPHLLSQQSSSSKKEKDALEDKRRNPILKYIAKPKSSSQSSE